MHIAVLLSLKKGMDHFVYRELEVFAGNGARLSLFPTKNQPGLYNPKTEWATLHWNPVAVILWQVFYMLRFPQTYLRLLGEARRFNAWMDFAIAWHFSAHMRDVDVIYSIFGDHKLFIGYFCSEILNRPQVVTLHAYELYQNPNPELFVHALKHCAQVITVTEYNRELLHSRFGIDPAGVRVVRVGVDLAQYRPQEKFVILIVAYFDARKGHEILFRAIKELSIPELEVWVVGSANNRYSSVDVKQLASDLQVESQVAFFGELGGAALKAVYRSCDVFCAPSRTDHNGTAEGFPTVLMEAMAFGKPVITTRHVEIPRIVPEMIVEENDVHGLAEAICTLYLSKNLRQSQGETNRKIAERYFSSDNARETAHILAEQAGGRPHDGRGIYE